jgi:prepilin peptidase CpaA
MTLAHFYVLLLCCAALSDVMSLRIPNLLTGAIVVLAVVAGLFVVRDVDWWLSHIGAGVLVLVIGMALFATGKIGGGDIKMMAAVALWHGFDKLAPLMIIIGIIGGFVGIVFFALRHFGFGMMLAIHGVRLQSLESKGVPYGVAIAAGSVMMLALGG